jgi:hypothetical protein
MYATVATVADGGASALIKMREGIYLETLVGLQRLAPAGRYKLTFGSLSAMLAQEGRAIFYFLNDPENAAFLDNYTEYATWNL